VKVQSCQSGTEPFDSEELMKITQVFKKRRRNKPENVTSLYISIVFSSAFSNKSIAFSTLCGDQILSLPFPISEIDLVAQTKCNKEDQN